MLKDILASGLGGDGLQSPPHGHHHDRHGVGHCHGGAAAGYGAGFSRAIEAIFAQWGTNLIGIFPGRTSQQAGGDKAGVQVRFTLDDVDRVSNSVPGVFHISPVECRRT